MSTEVQVINAAQTPSDKGRILRRRRTARSCGQLAQKCATKLTCDAAVFGDDRGALSNRLTLGARTFDLLDPFGNILSPEYLSAMRLRLIDGRWLSDADTLTTRPVIVVDRSFAKRYLSDRPIGMHVPVPFGEGRPDADVIGLVDDMRQADVTDAPAAEVFISYRQVPNRIPNGGMALVIRTVDDPMAHVAALRTVVREQDAANTPRKIQCKRQNLGVDEGIAAASRGEFF